MNVDSIPTIEQLHHSATALADRLRESVSGFQHDGTLPDLSLRTQILSHQRLDQLFRDDLKEQLERCRISATAPLQNCSREQLKLYRIAIDSVDQIQKRLDECRLQLAEAKITPEESPEVNQQLNQIEQLLQAPAVPLNETLIDFLSFQHPVFNELETTRRRVIAQRQSDAYTQASSLPAEVVDQIIQPEQADDSESSIFLMDDPPVVQEEQWNVVSEESELRITTETANQQFDFAENPADENLTAGRESRVQDAAEIASETTAAEVDPLDAADLIFDDFANEPTEKQILTAAELNQRFDQFQDEVLKPTADAISSNADPVADATANRTDSILSDSVFDEIEESQQSTLASTSKGMLRGHLPAAIEKEIAEVFEQQPSTITKTERPPLPIPEVSATVRSLPITDFTQIKEYAHRAANVQNRFDRVSYLSRLIWELVAQGEYSWAFQVSECLFANVDKDLTVPAPQPWLLKALILGDQVKFSTGRIAREFENVISRHRAEAMQIAENSEQPEAFLLRAAIMRGAVTTASPVASDILRTYIIQPDQTQLYNYCSRVASFSSQATGLKLDRYFYRPGAASIEADARSIRSQLTNWKSSVLDKLLVYRVATPLFSRAYWAAQPSAATLRPDLLKIWRTKQILKSHIIRLIQPILDNKLNQNSVMESELRRLTQSVIPDGNDTRVILSANESVVIRGKQIYQTVQQAIEYGSHWLVLAASFPGIESVLVPQQINELRDEIDRRQQGVYRELIQLEKTHGSHAHRAAITACRRNMDRIFLLFHPNEEPRMGEPDPACLLNADLLKIPGITLDEDWSCPLSPATREHQILNHLKLGQISWEEAFEQQLSGGSYRTAQSLLKLNVWSDEQLDRLRNELETRRRDNTQSLQDLAKVIHSQISQMQTIEIISTREAEQYRQQVQEIEQKMPTDYRHDLMRHDLIQIRQMLDGRRGVELKKMQQRMSQLSDFENQNINPALLEETKPASSHVAPKESPQGEESDDWALDV